MQAIVTFNFGHCNQDHTQYKFEFLSQQCRLIVSQMSNTRCDAFNWLLVAQSVIIVLSSFFVNMPHAELGLLYVFGFLALLAHIHYGACVVSTSFL